MRKVPAKALVPALTLLLVSFATACSSQKARDLARYYDPQGLFTTSLPADNTVTVPDPQSVQGGPSILSGVLSQPPAPSPSAQSGLGGIGAGLAQSAPTDQTVYEVLAVTTDTFPDLSSMTLYFLTGDPAIDVRDQRAIRLGGTPARMVVADVEQDGHVSASISAALSLGADGAGFVVAAIFPPGEWSAEEADFVTVVESFRAGVAPGLATFPLSDQAS